MLLLLIVILLKAFAGADPQDASSKTEQLFAQYHTSHGSQRVKFNYGSHVVPPRSKNDGMLPTQARIPAPCSNCLVTWMQAALEYPDGNPADADTGMWLHHVVFTNAARKDSICPDQVPGQRFFASGNERTAVDLTSDGKEKLGYSFGLEDPVLQTAELMNMGDAPQEVMLTTTWEFIPTHDPEFQQVVPYWLDIGGCGDSDKAAVPDTQLIYDSPRVALNISGGMAFIGGHLHDGGTHLNVLRNDKIVCQTRASYGQNAVHISEMSTCTTAIDVAEGDEWFVAAHYDTQRYRPMAREDGSLEPVMGIAIGYVVEGEARSAVSLTNLEAGWRLGVLLAAVLSIVIVVDAFLQRRKIQLGDAASNWT